MSRLLVALGIWLGLAGCWATPGAAGGVSHSAPVLQVELVDDAAGRTRIELWTLQDLRDLPQSTIHTTTPWTAGLQQFEGVRMAELLDRIGVAEGQIELRAVNDYSVLTTAEKLRETGAVLALRRNGDLMRSRDKGPLWLVWEYDASPHLRTETIYALSVWQLDRIRISR